MATINEIRIFISSPSDVNKERKDAIKVIEELNRTLCKPNGLVLSHLTWENDTYPSVGEYSQDVINKQIGKYDIFVGIMANRFGTPTPKAGSGTEEEFNIAYDNREHTQIMFFFKKKLIDPETIDDCKQQIEKVQEFKKKIGDQGVYFKSFSKGFQDVFRQALTHYITDKYIKRENVQDANEIPQTTRLKVKVEKYLRSKNPTYHKYSIISALAIPNSQFELKKIYVPQTLVKDNRFGGEEESIRIDGMPKELIKKYKKILITDTAGMGKSTITKRMFIDLIDNEIEGIGVPIYIELNRLNKDRSILQEIQDGLSPLSEIIDNDLLLTIIQTGGFIFFLDGYDEISIADKTVVTKDIQSFISRLSTDNYFILTSRPEDGLSSFGDFQSFKIQPLTKDDAFALLEKYDVGKTKKVSKKLIKLLKSGDYKSIDEYLINPLLVSLLYAAFDHKQTIPLKKHLFYRQVYEAYFDSHDLSKGIEAHQKRSGLDIDDFNRVLRFVGYECLIRVGVQFDKDTILSSIDRAREYCGNLSFSSNGFLKDLMTTVPLFTKDGPEYKWAHKSLMEYFSARFIAEDAMENQDRILTAIYRSERLEGYLNMLDIYYDIDFKGFSKNITLPYCEHFIETCNYNSKSIHNIRKNFVEERISCLFITDSALIISASGGKVKKYKNVLGLVLYNRLEIQHVNKIGVYFAAGRPTNSYHLARLLLSKKSPVVVSVNNDKEYDQLMHEGVTKEEISQLEHDKVHIIDVKTGSQSEVFYNSINTVFLNLFGLRTNYEACKKEVERIRKEIDQSKTSDLIDGI